jgi:predicted enzyme related to lactoylglutathione lyase/quinol monooxygenase YgiN
MIKIDRKFIEGVQAAASPAELHYYLHQAIKLEHSTIPPYLTAMFSLKPGTNRRIVELIRSVVNEEMLHMTIAANIVIATGGSPEINTPDFVPDYPGPLPMNIGDLKVGIEAFSISLTRDTFMAIEEPEHPIPVKTTESIEFATIVAFYDAIKKKLQEFGDKIFVKPTAPPQVVSSEWFPKDKLFMITDVESACRAIDLIKIEGEGTSASPFEQPGDPAHYYKFGEIVAGREIQKTPTGYAHSGAPILFEPSGVWPLKPNCKIADFSIGTQARSRIEHFAFAYSSLLNTLHEAFNGDPPKLNDAIGMMFDLRVLAVALMQTDAGDGSGLTVGPSFEFVQVQGGMPSTETSGNNPLSLTSTWYIATGSEAQAMSALNALVKDVQAGEPDTLIYLMHTPYNGDTRISSLAAPYTGTVVFFEMYRTVEAYERHINGPIFTNFLANFGNLFAAQNNSPFSVNLFLARKAGFVRPETAPGGVNQHPSVMFEIIAKDQPGLKAFYNKVFGWNYSSGSNDFAYVKFPIENLPLLGGIGKADPADPGFEAGNHFYLLVDDLRGAIDAAVAAGGSELLSPVTLDGYEFAMIKDPEGNAVGMIRPFQA